MLSGGERNRVHLAKMLKSGANVLLLDEPTNDLDLDTLRALEEALEDYAGCAVIISHDRRFLDRIATHILAFEGDSHVEWFEGNFEDYEEDKKRRLGSTARSRSGSHTRSSRGEARDRLFGQSHFRISPTWTDSRKTQRVRGLVNAEPAARYGGHLGMRLIGAHSSLHQVRWSWIERSAAGHDARAASSPMDNMRESVILSHPSLSSLGAAVQCRSASSAATSR